MNSCFELVGWGLELENEVIRVTWIFKQGYNRGCSKRTGKHEFHASFDLISQKGTEQQYQKKSGFKIPKRLWEKKMGQLFRGILDIFQHQKI